MDASLFPYTVRLLLGLMTITAGNLLAAASVQAQINPDRSLGTRVRRSGNTFNIRGGSRAGSNLFHSFSEFSLPTGDIAHFQNDLDINNIFSRVTGLSPSQIDGMIRVNGSANLFLLNPNGIVFGPNASLDIGGSFLATTADAIRFGEQGIFSATVSRINPAVLQVNPSALQFNREASRIAPIRNRSIANTGIDQAGFSILGLRVPNGESLVLLGGDVRMREGRLIAPGGRVEVGAVGESGEVGLTTGNALSLHFHPDLARADVSLTEGAQIDVSADRSGSIAIQAHDLQLLGDSSIYAGNSPDIVTGFGSVNSQARDLRIDATGAITVEGGGIFNQVYSEGQGNVGNITIDADSLSLTNGARVSSSTFGNGNGGNISVTVDGDITVDGTEQGDSSGIFSAVGSNAEGNASNIRIAASSLYLFNGAEVNSETKYSSRRSGNIYIETDKMTELSENSAIITNVDNGVGRTGDITIITSNLIIGDSSDILSIPDRGNNIGKLYFNAFNIFLVEGIDNLTDLESLVAATLSSDVKKIRNNEQIDISATSGSGIAASYLGLQQNALTPIAVNLTTPEQVIAGSCLARRNTENDRFVVTGTGGIPPSPYDAIDRPYNLTDVRPLDATPNAATPTESIAQTTAWKMGDPIEEAQELYATEDGRILLAHSGNSQSIPPAQDLICQ